MNTIVEEKIAESIVLEDVDAVTRGALFLDENVPNWYMSVDLDEFDICSGSSCIVGQIVAWGIVPESFFLYNSPNHMIYDPELGFEDVAAEVVDTDDKVKEIDGLHYPELQERWRDEIQQRRSGCHQH